MKFSDIVQVGTPAPRAYEGIMMRANPKLHEEVDAIISDVISAGSKIVDVGCGQGAFAARLRDRKYQVVAVDKNPDDFRARDVEFVNVDFDDPIQIESFKQENSEIFDAAIGMEVIEHVENPWEYVRFLLSLIKPNGVVVLTTPNAGSAHSRVDFMFNGLFSHFSAADRRDSGHINPLTFHELDIIAETLGVEVVKRLPVCRLPWVIVSKRPTVLLKSAIGLLLRPFMGPEARGDIILMVLRKPQAIAQ